MKSTRLKCPGVGMHLRESVFPETDPAFDGEFQIVRSAEQMQMIGHQEIIADKPGPCSVLPDFVEHALNRSLRQPTFTLLGAYSEENPIRPAGRNVNPFWPGCGDRVRGRGFRPWHFSIAMLTVWKVVEWAERQLCPTNMKVGRRCVAALIQILSELRNPRPL